MFLAYKKKMIKTKKNDENLEFLTATNPKSFVSSFFISGTSNFLYTILIAKMQERACGEKHQGIKNSTPTAHISLKWKVIK